MNGLFVWLANRGVREKRLLLAMLALLAVVLLYLLIVAPLSAAYRASLEEHLMAVDRNGRAKALAVQVGAAADGKVPNAPDFAQYVTDSARQRGFEASAQGSATSVTVSVARAAPSALLSWLSSLESAGFRLETLRIDDVGNGSVSAGFTVSRGQA